MDIELLNKLRDERGRVLVEFYATWCPHCRRMAPIVDELRERFGDKVAVYQFDVDENREFSDEMQVESLPTFIVFEGGEPVWRASGEMDGNELYEYVMNPE